MSAYDPAADRRWNYSSADPPKTQVVGPRSRSLTASARRLDENGTAYMRRLQQPWQLRSLGYYDTIGEINFTSKFLARQISRVRFYPARRLEDGTTEPIDTGAPVEILAQIQDPGGGTTQVQYDYGRLMFVTGEGVLFGYDGGTRWKFLWRDEVRRDETTGEWYRINYEGSPTGEVGVAYRVWAPHPRWSDLADSPMRAVQDICELILLLTLQTRATTVSRLTNNIMLVPQEASFGPVSVGLDDDPEQNPFMADLLEHISNQIENPGTASAAVPFIAEVPSDFVESFKILKTHFPETDYMEKDQLVEQIRRLSLSLDMSPEDLLGYTNANHWTGRQVQLDRWRMFGYNKAELWATSIADAYLRPALFASGYSEAPIDEVVIAFDDSQVVISPDRTEDALKANAQGLISGKAARAALGWNENDVMDEEEYADWMARQLRDPALLEGVDAGTQPARGPLPNPDLNGNVLDGPPAPGVTTGVSRQEAITSSALVLGAAQLALHRCRELAGVRIRFRCPDCADGQPDALVAASLGPERSGDPVERTKGGADGFRDLLIERGIERDHAGALSKQLEMDAARTLFEPKCPDLRPGFVSAVNKALEVSHVLS